MAKQFMPELTLDQRRRYLEDNADQVEQKTYMVPLSQDDLDAARERLAENYIELSVIDEEKKAVADGFKARTAPLIMSNRELLTQVKTKQREANGTLYSIANYDDGMMEVYDENGELIESRRLRANEKQRTIMSVRRTGTDD